MFGACPRRSEVVEVPSRFEISDELWAEIEPLIPARQRRHRYPGRKAIDDRLVLNGILHVLHTGIAWEDPPAEYGYGSGVTCWRRLRAEPAYPAARATGSRRLAEIRPSVARTRSAIRSATASVFFGRSLRGGASPPARWRSTTR